MAGGLMELHCYGASDKFLAFNAAKDAKTRLLIFGECFQYLNVDTAELDDAQLTQLVLAEETTFHRLEFGRKD